MPRVSKEVRMQIVQYSKNGMTQRAIQKVVGCSVQTVNRTVQRYRDYGTVRDMRREYRPRMTTEEEDRLIIAAVVDEPFLTAADIRRELGTTPFLCGSWLRAVTRPSTSTLCWGPWSE